MSKKKLKQKIHVYIRYYVCMKSFYEKLTCSLGYIIDHKKISVFAKLCESIVGYM
jgi:hypothetical protein